MSDRYAYLPQSQNVEDRSDEPYDYATRLLTLLGFRHGPIDTVKRAAKGLINHPFSPYPIEGYVTPPDHNPLGEQAGLNDILQRPLSAYRPGR